MREPNDDSAPDKAGGTDSENPEPFGTEAPAYSQHPEPPSQRESGLVVGVGASAGGLEAFSELIRNLPANTGMTFVLVQHLDPHHESILAELLGNYTQMQVTQVQDGVRVERDHVYVIPPNATMVLLEGSLRVSRPAHEVSHQRKPIDEFFVSLAETMRNRAIGVILSGAASDGTRGLKAIKSEGGITFAQDGTAKFDGMPRNAIAAGAVDFVLPPKRIAQELTRLAHHPLTVSAPEKLFGDSPAMEKILAVVRSTSGIDFRLYKEATIQRRVARRMALKTAQSLEEYVDVLEREPGEADALAEDLLIKVTEFFRDPAEFETLKRRVFPDITKDRVENEPLRLWVPGCSTGEEVYSIAIALLEFLEAERPSTPVQMFGTDASESVIAKARSGIYDESAVSAIGPERLRKFFTRCDSGYQINRNVRETCVFSRHVLGADPPFSHMDLVSCRNLLIYFAPALQQRVVDTLAYALRPGGFLFVGRSENTGRLSEFFDAVDEQSRIFVKRRNLDSHALKFIPEIARERKSQPLLLPATTSARGTTSAVQTFVDHMLLSRYGPSGVVIDKDLKVVEYRGDINRYMHVQAGKANQNFLEVLREDLAMHLRTAIEEAHQRSSTVRLDEIQIRQDRRFHFVRITVIPISIPSSDSYSVVLFEDLAESMQGAAHSPAPPPWRPSLPTSETLSVTSSISSGNWLPPASTCNPSSRNCVPPTRKCSPRTRSFKAATKNCKPLRKSFRLRTKSSPL